MNVVLFDIHIERFISSLEKSTIAKVLRTINLLETFGNKLGMPHSKPIKGGLFELRIRGSQEVRILYVFRQNNVVLLHAFLKKTNTISTKDLNSALKKKNKLD